MGYNLKEAANEYSTIQLIPEGRYTVTIENAEVKKSSTNKEMIKLTLSVLDKPYEKRKLWANLILEGKSFKYVIEVLKAYNSQLLQSIDVSAEEIAKDMLNKKVSVFVEQRNTEKGAQNVVSQFKSVETKSLFQ